MRYTILLLIMMVNLNGLPEPVEPPREVITVEATAYCACEYCCGKTDGITASGTKATAGRTIAADPSLPFGTVVVIDGHEYVVEDRGGGVKGGSSRHILR